jgi:glutamate racemase
MQQSKVIGVFDSGVGGLSVANAIKKAFPGYQVEYREDSKNLPYGTKTPKQLYELVLPILQELANICDVIVIACNTVTTTIIEDLRREIKIPIIGIEPMVKPAVQLTNSKVITVCATPTTLSSKRYAELKEQFGSNVMIIEPDCSDWAGLIEQNALNESKIREDIEPSLQAGSDVIVLACTHYHWIESEITKFVGSMATVLQPEPAIITRLKVLLEAN